jgi:hypothetical protein
MPAYVPNSLQLGQHPKDCTDEKPQLEQQCSLRLVLLAMHRTLLTAVLSIVLPTSGHSATDGCALHRLAEHLDGKDRAARDNITTKNMLAFEPC